MNVTDMTLEGFFLADYQRLRNENEELKAKLGEVVTVPDEYGCFDLKRTFEAVEVDLDSSYKLYDQDYGYTSEMLEKALKMDNDEFWKWCCTTRHGKSYWDSTPVTVKRHRFQYTLRFRETRSDVTLVTDGLSGKELYDVTDCDGEDSIGCWQSVDRLDYIKRIAMKLTRGNIEYALPRLREKEAAQHE